MLYIYISVLGNLSRTEWPGPQCAAPPPPALPKHFKKRVFLYMGIYMYICIYVYTYTYT